MCLHLNAFFKVTPYLRRGMLMNPLDEIFREILENSDHTEDKMMTYTNTMSMIFIYDLAKAVSI